MRDHFVLVHCAGDDETFVQVFVVESYELTGRGLLCLSCAFPGYCILFTYLPILGELFFWFV
jgi:hypothetical protein